MGSSILKGITTALLVTVVTLFAGIVWVVMHLGGLTISQLLDIGLLASCLVGGYRTAKESGEWLLGGIVGAGYVSLGTLLLSLFLPVQGWGFIQVLAEGAVIGLVAGAIGAGGAKGSGRSAWSDNRSRVTPSYGDYERNDRYSSQCDGDQQEEANDWKVKSMTTKNESEENSSEVQWSWDKDQEETRNDWKDSPITKGIERSEKNPEVEWPWDKEKEEERNDWKEAPITKRLESGKKSSDIQWPWNKEEEEHRDWKEAPITKPLESGEKSSVIKWPWNRTKRALVDLGPRNVEPRYVEPKYVEPLRISASTNNVSGDKPWWEQ